MPSQKEYKRRQQILKDAGYNVPTDGSWGKWQEQQWNKYLKDKYPVSSFIGEYIAQPIANFIGSVAKNAVETNKPIQQVVQNKEYHRLPLAIFNGMVGTTFSPVTTVATNTPVVKDVLPYLDLTKTSNLFNRRFYKDPNYKYLEHDYSEFSPTFNDMVQTAQIVAPIKYAKGVSDRSRILNTKYATKKDIKNAMHSLDKDGNPMLDYHREGFYSNSLNDRARGNNVVGPLVIIDKDKPNIEFHINPDVTVIPTKLIMHPETNRAIMMKAGRVQNSFPSNTILTSDGFNITKSQYLQSLPKWKQDLYKYTSFVKKPKKEISKSFSTDILENMLSGQTKGMGHIEYAYNGLIDGLNNYGLRYNNWSKYFNKPDYRGNVYFQDMTPQQIIDFNASQNLIQIDPITRTAPKPMFITK